MQVVHQLLISTAETEIAERQVSEQGQRAAATAIACD